jgi:hypothetical protein
MVFGEISDVPSKFNVKLYHNLDQRERLVTNFFFFLQIINALFLRK